ncbi:diaminobutyrate--2-oxoglutarate transaminase [Ectothiorhodospira shaposhnikovii]|uniref:diaminobutyrate--2-oxoglutarate transaminase n=1 Tax=Ectothiorhodospira shaposhnikovii TaxID=1054 RepID=UPI001906EE80|nr:diaminobutyrate--2-oxoglutarate transaminase [Ectothiorhodospira shaposhnikovii]MBK1674845.1 diaminobutyrate--2-oxoglutarate transaminase [Ectothiorhodospira shaposhnikovii]
MNTTAVPASQFCERVDLQGNFAGTRPPEKSGLELFERHESNVRSYCRSFPRVFATAKGAFMFSEEGQSYLDFLSGAGALNYGHNHDFIKVRLMTYIAGDGLSHGLDLHTDAKSRFIERFVQDVLEPRGLDYKLQFCGPTGTNAVEAALKIARRVTGRNTVCAFQGGYHGMTLGSLAITGNRRLRRAAGIEPQHVMFLPYPDERPCGVDAMAYLERLFDDTHSGCTLPAAIILETVQAEGGVYVAPIPWLQRLEAFCRYHGILLICDDIQVGCFRTGPFFSFERACIRPDIVTLSKSISGYGLPMALVLLRPELDVWEPGEHNGTFRGNQLAFVAGEAALEYAKDFGITARVMEHEAVISAVVQSWQCRFPQLQVRGLGMIWGVDFAGMGGGDMAARISRGCFDKGLIVETAGRGDAVLKLLPPLNIPPVLLEHGLRTIEEVLNTTLGH